jgi:hypothetical protein
MLGGFPATAARPTASTAARGNPFVSGGSAPAASPPFGGGGGGAAGDQVDQVEGEPDWAWPPEIAIRYEDIVLGKRIGAGAFSEVYRGLYRGTQVAVKRMLLRPVAAAAALSGGGGGNAGAAGAAATEAARLVAEFRAEVTLMARLRHPNIVLLMGATSRPLCLVMEYCSRGTLFDMLHNTGVALSWRLRLQMALDAARGMNCLHTCSPVVMHR